MNPLDVMLKELNTGGMSVEVKRHRSDGILENTKPNELATLGTKAKLASTAALLKKLTKEERLEWAVEMKNHGNDFYAQLNYQEAMTTYVEALTASDFGSVESLSNIDNMIVPVLCNLSACCIQLEQWNKAVQFSQQALNLRPDCVKAQLRKGMALVRMREYSDALNCLKTCQQYEHSKPAIDDLGSFDSSTDFDCVPPQGVSSQISLSENDQKKLNSLLLQARKGVREERAHNERQRVAMRRAFPTEEKKKTALELAGTTLVVNAAAPKNLMSLTELLVFVMESLWEWLVHCLFRPTTTR
jgi:tetratricopeptide (TPR) repeat protein